MTTPDFRTQVAPLTGTALVIAAALSARLFHSHAPGWVFNTLLFSWALGILLVSLRWRHPVPKAPASQPASGRRAAFFSTRAADVAMLFATALAWRAIGINALPANLLGDEAAQVAEAVKFVTGELANPFGLSEWYGVPLLYPWLVHWPLTLFGLEPWAWRLPTAIAGAASVPILYLALRTGTGNGPGASAPRLRAFIRSSHVASLAALALCFQHLSLYFSRLGSNQGFDGLFLATVLWCLAAAFMRPAGPGWYAAGVVSGLGFHFYFALRGIAVITLAVIAMAVALDLRRNGLPPPLRLEARPKSPLRTEGPLSRPSRLSALHSAFAAPLGGYLLGLALAAAPLLVGPASTSELMARTIQVIDLPGSSTAAPPGSPGADLVSRAVTGLQSIQGHGLRGWYESGAGLLVTRLELALLVLGAARALHAPRHQWMHIAYLAGIVGAVALFTENPVGSQRITAAAVPAAVLIAMGADTLGRMVWPRRRALIGTALVASIATAHVAHLFLSYLPRREHDITALVATELVQFLSDRPDIQDVVFCGGDKMGWRSNAALPLLAPEVRAIDVQPTWEDAGNTFSSGAVLITAPTCPQLRDRYLAEPGFAATQLLLRSRLTPREALRMLMSTRGRGFLRTVHADLPGIRYHPDEVEVFTVFELETSH